MGTSRLRRSDSESPRRVRGGIRRAGEYIPERAAERAGTKVGAPGHARNIADEILPVTGSTQAMDLLCKALIDPGDKVVVENPTFLGNMQAIRLYQAQLVPVDSDEEGVIVEAAEALIKEHHPKLLYVIPTFQNPTGITLSLERRKALAALAAKYGVVVAEDDPYRDLRYSGEELPSDQVLRPGGLGGLHGQLLQVYLSRPATGRGSGDEPAAAEEDGHRQAERRRALAPLNQAIVDAYLRKGLMPGHLQRICGDYRRQLNAMLAGLDNCFPEGTRIPGPRAACSSGRSCPRAWTPCRPSTRPWTRAWPMCPAPTSTPTAAT